MSRVPKRVAFKGQDDVYIYPKADSASPPLSSDEDDWTSPDAAPNRVDSELDIEMSKFMRSAIMSPWNVSTKPAPKNADQPALANPDVKSLLIGFKPSFFPGEIMIEVREGISFITVGKIYSAIDAYLDEEVAVTDSMFTDHEPQVQEEIRLSFNSRSRSRVDGRVQLVDFLGRNKFLKRISVDNASKKWVVRFGTEGEEGSDIR